MTTQTAGAGPTPVEQASSKRPSKAASKTSTKSLLSRITNGWHSGSPKRTLYSKHLRALVGHHDAGIEHAAKRPPLTLHGVHGRHQNVLFDPMQLLSVDDRSRAVGAHSAGVRAGIAVESALVVLRGRQGQNGLTIGDCQDADFLAVEPFLDDQLIPGIAEFLGDSLHGLDASFRPAQTTTPLPPASPSALTTTGTSSRSFR